MKFEMGSNEDFVVKTKSGGNMVLSDISADGIIASTEDIKYNFGNSLPLISGEIFLADHTINLF